MIDKDNVVAALALLERRLPDAGWQLGTHDRGVYVVLRAASGEAVCQSGRIFTEAMEYAVHRLASRVADNKGARP